MEEFKLQESEKIKKFDGIIAQAAAKQNAVFFAFAGEGDVVEIGDIEAETLSGWLIPIDKAEQFKKKWEKENSMNNLEDWIDYFMFAEWELVNGEIKIKFIDYSVGI